MRNKLILTIIWLLSFLVAFLIVNSYNDGIIIMDGLLEHMKPILAFYTPYLSGILAFWYFKPFKRPANAQLENIRFYLALVTTVGLNLVVIYYTSNWYLSSMPSIILDDISNGVKLGGLLSFLVAPANAYYFGMKTGG